MQNTERGGSISPGRWAVGYNYVYVLARVLNETEPHRILDMGLGISSSLISRYIDYKNFEDSEHIITEHDQEWIHFWTKNNQLSAHSRIAKQELENKIKDGHRYFAYADLKKDLNGKKFSFISIDAPFGSDKYSRRDILEFLPDILDEDFVIMMDDTERQGEKNTIRELQAILKISGIRYEIGWYDGMSDCCIIVSPKNKFLCSL